VAHKVAAIFLVVFSVVVIGLGRGADALAPRRTRLTSQFHRMLDRDAGVSCQRPSLAAAIARFHRSMDSTRGKLTDMVTRKKACGKLQTGIGTILKEQRERQRLMEEEATRTTTEGPRRTTGTGRAAGARASKSGFSIVPDVESEAPRETMIDSKWSAKQEQIAWADIGLDSAKRGRVDTCDGLWRA
jgi:hypothetical protein